MAAPSALQNSLPSWKTGWEKPCSGWYAPFFYRKRKNDAVGPPYDAIGSWENNVAWDHKKRFSPFHSSVCPCIFSHGGVVASPSCREIVSASILAPSFFPIKSAQKNHARFLLYAFSVGWSFSLSYRKNGIDLRNLGQCCFCNVSIIVSPHSCPFFHIRGYPNRAAALTQGILLVHAKRKIALLLP